MYYNRKFLYFSIFLLCSILFLTYLFIPHKNISHKKVNPDWKKYSNKFISLYHPTSWGITSYDNITILETQDKTKKIIRIRQLPPINRDFDNWCNNSLICRFYKPYKKDLFYSNASYVSLYNKTPIKVSIITLKKSSYVIEELADSTGVGGDIATEKKAILDPVYEKIKSTLLFKDVEYDTKKTVRILPVGDSLTAFYQGILYKTLHEEHNSTYISVGTLKEAKAPPLDYHEGHYGYIIDKINYMVADSLLFYEPDIILLMTGTNDIARNLDYQNAPERFKQLLQNIQSDLPKSYIFASSIPPMNLTETHDYYGGIVRTNFYNSEIKKIILQNKQYNKKLFFVDMHSVIQEKDLVDQVHPRPLDKMANAWIAELKRLPAKDSVFNK